MIIMSIRTCMFDENFMTWYVFRSPRSLNNSDPFLVLNSSSSKKITLGDAA